MTKEILLMLPGPTKVNQRVLNALSRDIVNHRGALFGEILKETSELMSEVFKTKNKSYIITGSGTSAMEAALANVINPGDKTLHVVGGKFGQRFQQIAETFGADARALEVEWGTAVDPEDLRKVLEEDKDIKLVTVVHNETSTGVCAPIKEIGEVLADFDALFILDAVSSLGGDYVDVDGYGVDICVTGSQKCLAAPPGLAAITLSDAGVKAVEELESPKSYYLNMKKIIKSGDKEAPQTPYTPAVSLIYALNEALKEIKEEGLDNRVERHQLAAKATKNAVKALGLELFSKEECSSATVTAVKMPEGITDSQLRGTMRDKYGVELAGGQDHLKGNIFRIGHMGNITYKELAITFTALSMTLKELGFDVDLGAGVGALAETYLEE